MRKTEKNLIAFLLQNEENFQLAEFMKTITGDFDNNIRTLDQLKTKMVRAGQFKPAKVLCDFICSESLSDSELVKIIKVAWKKNRIADAISALACLAESSANLADEAIAKAYAICFYRAKNGEDFYRQEYREAVTKIMAIEATIINWKNLSKATISPARAASVPMAVER